MKQLDSIAIIGVGLIGASVGLAVRRCGLAHRVIGIGREGSRSLAEALRMGAISEGTSDIGAGVATADLTIVCTPVDTIAGYVQTALDAIPDRGLVTDAGSTKASILAKVATHPASARFIGSHPMAGSHLTGPENGHATLFDQRPVIVTPGNENSEAALEQIEAFWQALGAQTLRLTPSEHDQAVAMISHLPHVVAAALAANTPAEHLPLASSGWADTTRIAAGDVQLWLQILNDNRDHVLKSLDKFGKVLTQFRDALATEDNDRLGELLQAGKHTRDRMEEQS